MKTRSFPVAAIVCAFIFSLFAVSCGPDSGVQEITETRTLNEPKPAPPSNVSSAERFGFQRTTSAAAAVGPSYTWETPEGWVELPANSMRIINLQPAGNAESECYFSIFSGGVPSNVNRWRQQMSLEPLAEEEMGSLAKLPMLGGEGTYVELEGTYVGMSGDQSQADYMMLGLILDLPDGRTAFVKMVGPKGVIEPEKGRFAAFCASIAPGGPAATVAQAESPGAAQGSGGVLPPDHPPIGPGAPVMGGAGFDQSQLSWTAPEGWKRGRDRQMRVVTYTVGENDSTECYVAVLANMGGGVDANINRWAEQMGNAPLDAAGLAGLPRITILGKPAPMCEFTGEYTDMAGTRFTGYTMLGAIGEADGTAVFVKMVGPQAVVQEQKTNFVAFCESLQ